MQSNDIKNVLPTFIEPTKEWFENLDPNTLSTNNYFVETTCKGCFQFKRIPLNYFVRVAAKLYASKDINPPASKKKHCINDDRDLKKSENRLSTREVVNIICDLAKTVDEIPIGELYCRECWLINLKRYYNSVENELINCHCVRSTNFESYTKINVKFCRHPTMEETIKNHNDYIYYIYIQMQLKRNAQPFELENKKSS